MPNPFEFATFIMNVNSKRLSKFKITFNILKICNFCFLLLGFYSPCFPLVGIYIFPYECRCQQISKHLTGAHIERLLTKRFDKTSPEKRLLTKRNCSKTSPCNKRSYKMSPQQNVFIRKPVRE